VNSSFYENKDDLKAEEIAHPPSCRRVRQLSEATAGYPDTKCVGIFCDETGLYGKAFPAIFHLGKENHEKRNISYK
jgi:hypothetical protein